MYPDVSIDSIGLSKAVYQQTSAEKVQFFLDLYLLNEPPTNSIYTNGLAKDTD